VFSNLDERSFSVEDLLDIGKTIFDSWDQEIEFTDEGIESVVISSSGGVDVDEHGGGFFDLLSGDGKIFFGSN
jgi:hypothetical protein